jgi:hypothetical protein
MKYFQAPDTYQGHTPTLYLAGPVQYGGWRTFLAEQLGASHWVLLDPTRNNYADLDGPQRRAQIEWEVAHLRRATAAAFWLAPPTPCSMTLMELGIWASTGKPLFVAIHSRYGQDEEVRMRLAVLQPQVRVVSSLAGLAQQLFDYACDTNPARMTA